MTPAFPPIPPSETRAQEHHLPPHWWNVHVYVCPFHQWGGIYTHTHTHTHVTPAAPLFCQKRARKSTTSRPTGGMAGGDMPNRICIYTHTHTLM